LSPPLPSLSLFSFFLLSLSFSDLFLTLRALRIIPSLSWHSARLARTLARRREEEEEEAEEGAPSPLARSSADDFFFVFASSPATAASRILTAEARSPACRASTSAEVGAIAYRVCVCLCGGGVGGENGKESLF